MKIDYSREPNFFRRQVDAHSRWIFIQNPSVGGFTMYKTKRANKKWFNSRIWFNASAKDLLARTLTTCN